jgi:hypothetical protein
MITCNKSLIIIKFLDEKAKEMYNAIKEEESIQILGYLI